MSLSKQESPSRTRTRAIRIGRPRKNRWLVWIVNGAAVLVLLAAVTAPLWLRRTVRWLIPPRYIAAYAPVPVQDFIYSDINAQHTLPTPIASPAGSGNSLLTELGTSTALAPALPSATPVIAGNTGGTSQTPLPLQPTLTFTPTLPPMTPTPQIPDTYLLTGFTYTPQGWNNCGPATLTTVLSYWGVHVTQDQTASALKGSTEDVNVSPNEIVTYVESLGLQATTRIDGDINLLKRLVAAGYPVVIERGFDEEPEKGWMGHYMLIIGYSDETRQFSALDVYWGWKHYGFNEPFPVDYWDYDRLDELWRHFNRTYYVIYPPKDAGIVASIIGPDMNDQTMYASAVERARNELLQNQNDLWGWFNLGGGLNGLGDYQSAALAFDQAQVIGLPRRMLWYEFGPYEAYLHVGRYDDVIALAKWTLNYSSNPQAESEEAWYYRGLAVLAQGDRGDARYFFTLAVQHNSHFEAARLALEQLDNGG